MGFRSDVSRVPVFGLGCAGGASGLSIASRLAQARPGTNVLLVTIELCSLALRLDELTKANIIATSLFGDGAAAIVLRAGDGGATQIEHTGEHLWPNTLDVMGWSVDPLEFVQEHQAGLQSFRSMRRIEARRKNARPLRLRFSQSLASLRQRLSQAMVRSTIHRLGSTTNALA